MPPQEAKTSPTIIVPIEFYRGINEIAQFLGVHERTARRRIAAGELPVKQDASGTWILTNIDYYKNLVG